MLHSSYFDFLIFLRLLCTTLGFEFFFLGTSRVFLLAFLCVGPFVPYHVLDGLKKETSKLFGHLCPILQNPEEYRLIKMQNST